MQPILVEARSKINEQAHITGVALIPRISRNNNLYTKEELRRFHGMTVPLNWEHDTNRVIGEVTFSYNQDLETVYYEGDITDEAAAQLARNKILFTSIEADPVSMKDVCNAPGDCFHMPFGLVPVGMALTETPGVPETTVKVWERYIKESFKECKADHDLEGKYAPHQTNLKNEDHIRNLLEQNDCVSVKMSKIADDHPEWTQDKRTAVAISMCSTSEVKQLLAERVYGITGFCGCCGESKKKV